MLPSRTVDLGEPAIELTDGSRVAARLDGRGRAIAADLGIEISMSPLVIWLAVIVLAPVIGSRLAGIAFGIGAGAAALLLPIPLARLAAGRRRLRVWYELPELCAQLSRSLRSGRSLPQALELALGENDTVVPPGLVATVHEQRAGRSLDESLVDWSKSVTHDAERLLVTALKLGVTLGGDIAVCLEAVGSGVRDEILTESKRRELTAQARISAWVLAALPIGFGLVMSAARGEPMHRGTNGMIFVVVGLTLDAAGLLWMFRLVRGLR